MSTANWEDLLEIGQDCYERFVNQDNVPEMQQLGVACAGVSQLRGRYWVARRKPDYHTLLFTVEGRGKLLTEAGEQDIETNTLTLLPVNQPFHFSIAAPAWSTAWFCLDDLPQWQQLKQQPGGVSFTPHASPIYYLLCQLYYEPELQMRRSPVRQLKTYLLQSLGQTETPDPLDHQRRLDTLFSELQQQLHVNWSVETMAGRIHYSASHLHRLCQQVYGQSPMQKLLELRMERARQLLTTTHWSLTQIASTLGYQDVFNFSNRFKKYSGLAPSLYRRQHRGG